MERAKAGGKKATLKMFRWSGWAEEEEEEKKTRKNGGKNPFALSLKSANDMLLDAQANLSKSIN